jgi:hypothetical protein
VFDSCLSERMTNVMLFCTWWRARVCIWWCIFSRLFTPAVQHVWALTQRHCWNHTVFFRLKFDAFLLDFFPYNCVRRCQLLRWEEGFLYYISECMFENSKLIKQFETLNNGSRKRQYDKIKFIAMYSNYFMVC